jgi:hypothetical protein
MPKKSKRTENFLFPKAIQCVIVWELKRVAVVSVFYDANLRDRDDSLWVVIPLTVGPSYHTLAARQITVSLTKGKVNYA